MLVLGKAKVFFYDKGWKNSCSNASYSCNEENCQLSYDSLISPKDKISFLPISIQIPVNNVDRFPKALSS